MLSKEALKDISYLILQEVDNLKYKDLWKEALNTIKQDLERLEVLEREYNNLQRDYDNKDLECIDLYQENEKLKKVIEIYTKLSTIDKESTTSYLVRNGMITQQEYELLKEVLGNE